MTDYTKLIERLRSGYQGIQLGAVGMGWDFDAKTIIEAAEAIEALAAENERLKSEREALRDSAKEVVRLRDALQSQLDAMGKGEPIYQYQLGDGSWIDQAKQSYDYNKNHAPNAVVRIVYAAPKALAPEQGEIETLRKALRFYANKWHFIKYEATAWDTVSGEPVNFEEDENGTACVEDGSIAALVLRGLEIRWEDEEPPALPDEAAHGIGGTP